MLFHQQQYIGTSPVVQSLHRLFESELKSIRDAFFYQFFHVVAKSVFCSWTEK